MFIYLFIYLFIVVDTSFSVCLNESVEYIRPSCRTTWCLIREKARCTRVTFFRFYFDRHLGRKKLRTRKDADADAERLTLLISRTNLVKIALNLHNQKLEKQVEVFGFT